MAMLEQHRPLLSPKAYTHFTVRQLDVHGSGRLIAPIYWVDSHPVLSLHLSSEPSELSQSLWQHCKHYHSVVIVALLFWFLLFLLFLLLLLLLTNVKPAERYLWQRQAGLEYHKVRYWPTEVRCLVPRPRSSSVFRS